MLPLAPEMLSLIGGGLLGAFIKIAAQNAADRQQITELLLKKAEFENLSKNDAAKRAPGKAGELTRRVIILAILFGVILAPFVLTLLQLPTIVQVETPARSFLGLFEYGGKTKFYQLLGYLITPEIRQSLLALIGFYFGCSAGKRTNL
jgi:sterol desaturase/sphingolipid hydroxylase (fatty acid hydroxylase superfamily)